MTTAYTPKPTTCGSCLYWRCPQAERLGFGDLAVGTCAQGGPEPGKGCGDSMACETCPKWQMEAKHVRPGDGRY